jgi:acetyltransferase-like isoleucine patch superfamily enzyme
MTMAQGSVSIDPTATIAETAVIGARYRPLLDGRELGGGRRTTIGANCWIGERSSVGTGTTIGVSSIVHGDVHVEGDVTIGSRVLLTYRCWIDIGVTIGDDCVLGGFICERARLGHGCRVFGSLIHAQHNPQTPWDGPGGEEDPPVLKYRVFVGWGATVIGSIVLGERAYVAAGAIVSRSVPSRYMPTGATRSFPTTDGREPWGVPTSSPVGLLDGNRAHGREVLYTDSDSMRVCFVP